MIVSSLILSDALRFEVNDHSSGADGDHGQIISKSSVKLNEQAKLRLTIASRVKIIKRSTFSHTAMFKLGGLFDMLAWFSLSKVNL